jgi:hypothetical protein
MRPYSEPNQVHDNLGRNCTTLFFNDSEDADFYMRGSICWPIEWPSGNEMEISGHAIIAGMDVKTKDITVFKEHSFMTVSNILNDGVIEYPGLETFFNSAWSKYFCRDYYWHGNEVTTKQWRLETIRNELIRPKPHFIKVDWSDDDQSRMQMWREFKTGKVNLKPIGRNSTTSKQITNMRKDKKTDLPAVHALIALIAGMKRYPWRG